MIRFNFDNVALRVGGHRLLKNTNWEIDANHSWAVIGPNGSGKTTLMRALAGEAAVVAGRIYRNDRAAQPDAIGITGFERQNQLIRKELAQDSARIFSGKEDDHLTVGDFLKRGDQSNQSPFHETLPLTATLDIDHLFEKPLRQLSMGELQRVFLLKTVLQPSKVMVLDEPFENLDHEHRQKLSHLLETLIQNGVQLFLVTHRLELIPHSINRIIALKSGRVFAMGSTEKMLTPDMITQIYDAPLIKDLPENGKRAQPASPQGPLIALNNVTISYDGKTIIGNLNWQVQEGEHWAVVGPNGCGKTTLLRLLYGDHLQAYANDVRVFGSQRGQGESIWEIKQNFSWVGPEMQRNYRQKTPVGQVIASGLFDTNGLYRPLTVKQFDRAHNIADRFSMEPLLQRAFGHLSYGQQRMVLIARAMIKNPRVLILDEPCQGLDPVNRENILALADQVAHKTSTQLIYISHHVDERPDAINKQLDLSGPPYRVTFIKGTN